jgi:hypothetical protein
MRWIEAPDPHKLHDWIQPFLIESLLSKPPPSSPQDVPSILLPSSFALRPCLPTNIAKGLWRIPFTWFFPLKCSFFASKHCVPLALAFALALALALVSALSH